jgi:hypothetical protein
VAQGRKPDIGKQQSLARSFRDFYIKNDILTWAVVTVIAEPIRGEVPLRGPKRS